jgi:hypothetical protein
MHHLEVTSTCLLHVVIFEKKLEGQIFLKFCATYRKEYSSLVHISPTINLTNSTSVQP